MCKAFHVIRAGKFLDVIKYIFYLVCYDFCPAANFIGKGCSCLNELIFFENKEIMGDSCAVFSPWRKMFGKEGQNEITHGGIHLEEVVVPFVEVMS